MNECVVLTHPADEYRALGHRDYGFWRRDLHDEKWARLCVGGRGFRDTEGGKRGGEGTTTRNVSCKGLDAFRFFFISVQHLPGTEYTAITQGRK